MVDRCSHDMLPGLCIRRNCPHYDGEGSLGTNPRSKSHRLPKREKVRPPCGHCETRPRAKGYGYCEECIERFGVTRCG